jgi:FkbM family methyltransferase
MRIVFEDEYVLLEWTQATPAVDAIAVTFDPISVPPTEPAYAAHFLHRLGIDTLCVRKKQEHFYQPLSRERFEEVTGPVLAHYRRRLAYGSSLGAYAVMYFCVHGFDTVIASSPRVSAHPRLGRTYWQQRVPFEHDAFDAQRPASSGAVVFYDPHDEIDRMLVDEELRPAWPRADFVPVPYAGHPANQFLSEIGYISPFVQAVMAGRAPPLLDRRSAKARAPAYLFVLGAACMRHGKVAWAEQLCRRALSLRPDFISVHLTLGQALLAQDRLDEAEIAIRSFLERQPLDGQGLAALRDLDQQRARLLAPAVPPLAAPQASLLATQLRRLREGANDFAQLVNLKWQTWTTQVQHRSPWLRAALGMAVKRDDIVWCYRNLLGREPESEQVLLDHRHHRRLDALVRTIMASSEYRRRLKLGDAGPPDERFVELAVEVRRLLPSGGQILEIGSATCLRSAYRREPGAKREPHEPVFDICLNTESLAHADPEAHRLFGSARQALKPGGVLLWSVKASAKDDAHHSAVLLRRHGFGVFREQRPSATMDGHLLLARRQTDGAGHPPESTSTSPGLQSNKSVGLQSWRRMQTPRRGANSSTFKEIEQVPYQQWFQAGLSEQLGVGNFFESVIEDIYTLTLSPGDIAIDGGASRGRHTIPMFRCVGHRGLVFGIEPVRHLAHALIDRCRAEGLSGITIVNQALGEEAGRVGFVHVKDLDGWSGILQRKDLPSWAAAGAHTLDLPMITLDALIAEQRLPSVRFVKLDLSGGEYDALRGGRTMLQAVDAPLVAFENGRQASADLYGYTADDWFALFRETGYQVFDLFGRPFELAAWRTDGIPWYYLAAKREADLRFIRDELPGLVAGTYRRLMPGAA